VMKIGILIPTREEAVGLPAGIPCATGFGPGKTAACAAVSKLLFQDGCDAIFVWGTAGALRREQPLGGMMVVDQVAYSDYDVSPLYGSDGLGFVPEIAETCWMDCHPGFLCALREKVPEFFPNHPLLSGRIAAGDVFDNAKYYRADNRIENAADGVDMESPAVVHFCRLAERIQGRTIPVGVLRLLSNYIGVSAGDEFLETLKDISAINAKMGEFLPALAASLEEG
jgi:nucleoside phosphorylase